MYQSENEVKFEYDNSSSTLYTLSERFVGYCGKHLQLSEGENIHTKRIVFDKKVPMIRSRLGIRKSRLSYCRERGRTQQNKGSFSTYLYVPRKQCVLSESGCHASQKTPGGMGGGRKQAPKKGRQVDRRLTQNQLILPL